MARTTTWRDVLAASLREHGVRRLSDRAVDALAAEMALIDADPDLRALARSSTAANLALVAEITSGALELDDTSAPPQAVAFAREFARRNIPVAELARAYRLVQHAMWRFGVAELRERTDGGEATATAIEQFTDATFATGEALMAAAMDRYAVERDRWVRSADALRRTTVEKLLRGGAVDAQAESARLRYALQRDHVGFVVWSDEDEAALESAAAAVGGPGSLLVPHGDGVVAGWCAPGSFRGEGLLPGTRAATGAPGPGLDGFRTTHAEALEARRVALLGGLPGIVRYEDVALLALLTKDVEQARRFAATELGPLAHADETTTRLAETVLLVLEEQGSRRHAASRMGVHENTVAKRVRVAEELLGRRVSERPTELMAALLIRRALLGPGRAGG